MRRNGDMALKQCLPLPKHQHSAPVVLLSLPDPLPLVCAFSVPLDVDEFVLPSDILPPNTQRSQPTIAHIEHGDVARSAFVREIPRNGIHAHGREPLHV